MKIIELLFFLSIIWQPLSGQNVQPDIQSGMQDLQFYADVMINASRSDHRIKAHDTFYSNFKKFLEEPGSFDRSLEDIEWISTQTASDLSFRIISWQLKRSDRFYDYYCFLQLQNGQLFEFGRHSATDQLNDFEAFNPEEWHSQLVYGMEEFDSGEGHYYLLFGYIQRDKFTKVKSVDVLHIEDGVPIFGKPIFEGSSQKENQKKRCRIILEYTADALTTLNYNTNLNLLIFDHLIPRMGRMEGQGPTMVPDGSYEAYSFKEGRWIYIEKVYDQIFEEAPRPNPKKSDKSLDLFGRKKKKN